MQRRAISNRATSCNWANIPKLQPQKCRAQIWSCGERLPPWVCWCCSANGGSTIGELFEKFEVLNSLGVSRDKPSSPSNWPKDEFGRNELIGQFLWVGIPLLAVVSALMLFLINRARIHNATQVVVYCAQDQIYAEPIFREFEKQTGIKVLAVYDNESVK